VSRRYSSSNSYRQDPLRGRRLWRYGDWGSAGEYIGRHWEAIATPILTGALGRVRLPLMAEDPAYRPRVLISLVADAALAEQIHGAGLAHADTILLGYGEGGRVVAEPVDFKWSLETAEPRQVSAHGLATLLNAGLSHLDAQMAAALAELHTLGPHPEDAAWGPPLPMPDPAAPPPPPPLEPVAEEEDAENTTEAEETPAPRPRIVEVAQAWGAVRCRDGVFFAPHNQANLHYLNSDWNGRKGEPLGPDQVWFEEVDGPTFFGVLPGWNAAEALAGYDRSTAMLQTIDGAERYYRLGAGSAGALTRWHTSIFSETPAMIDVVQELEELRRAQRLWTSTDLSLYLERMMNVRAEREGALRDWLRELYGWGRFRGDLGRAGVEPRELESKGGKRRWGAVFGQITRSIEARVKADGLTLIAAPMSDMAALEELQKRTTDLQAMAGATATQVIRDELAGRRPPPAAPSVPQA
jgi:hypothetical protein